MKVDDLRFGVETESGTSRAMPSAVVQPILD